MECRAREAGDRRLRRETTGQPSPKFLPPEDRIATFDQDGTLWLEHPMYTFMTYALERTSARACNGQAWLKEVEPTRAGDQSFTMRAHALGQSAYPTRET
jgi:hypothetical protein